MRTSPWLAATYVAVIVLGILTALPNLLSPATLDRLPAWFPRTHVSLGLDLKGGSHLVLEVDAAALAEERLQTLVQDARKLLRTADISTSSIRRVRDTVTVVLADPATRNRAATELRKLANAVGLGGTASDLDVEAVGEGTLALTLTEAGLLDRRNAAVGQSLEIIRQRIDQVGVAEPTIQRVGADRILVQLPGVQDPARIRQLLGSTAKMSFHLLAEEGGGRSGVTPLKDTEGRVYPVLDRVELAGDRLTDARVGFDPRTNEPLVSFRFDNAGATRFAEITKANVGHPFAIVLDDKVLSAPVIREPITGGSGQISGSFTVQQANDLAALLRAGALPAKLTVIEERTVGADLGGDAIRMGVTTGLAGFALVVSFMLLLYGAWGLLANLALGLNVVLTFAALSLLGATLTLPGIAGVVLGVGLAVDANVLINERIREETAKGRGDQPPPSGPV